MNSKNLLSAAILAASTAVGCHSTAPQSRLEYGSGSNPETACAVFVRESVGDTLDLRAGEPLQKEIGALDVQLREDIFGACKSYHDATGEYPGMK